MLIKNSIRSRVGMYRVFRDFLFRTSVQEWLWRRTFFYNAFKALSFNGIEGDYVEFGCWGGRTFAIAYEEARRHGHPATLWAFDSFEGLPTQQTDADDHPVWLAGNLATSEADFLAICAAKGIPRERFRVVPGYYEDSLPALGTSGAPIDIALAYIDCDLYSSTKTVLEFLLPRLKHGMIIAFDDYFCWSQSQISGERKAQLEIFTDESPWSLLPYVQFGWHGQSFIVEDKRIISN